MKDEFDLKGKIAIVTGGSRGIGKAIALLLAKHGADTVIADILLPEAKKTAKGITKKTGSKTIAIKTDVSNRIEVNAMVKETMAKFGRIDILVNNAGIYRPAPLESMEEKEWDKIIAINLKGQMLCAQAAGNVMIKQKSGVIVNITSVAGLFAFAQSPAYDSSKAGIVLLTKTLALDWAKYGIRVNAVAPGVIETPMTAKFLEDKAFVKSTLMKIPLARIGKPEDIADVVLFLASDVSSYVTGHVLVADGGWTCHL